MKRNGLGRERIWFLSYTNDIGIQRVYLLTPFCETEMTDILEVYVNHVPATHSFDRRSALIYHFLHPKLSLLAKVYCLLINKRPT